MDQREYDAIVVGGGPAGEVVAGRLGGGGLRTLLVERELIGGECSYWACMPSKALLRPAEALAEVRRLPGAAEAVTGTIDVGAVLRRRDEVIHHLDDSSQVPWLEDRGVEILRGEAEVTGEREVTVGATRITARRAVVLATGSRPAMPPIPGLEGARPWTNREATTAAHVPDRLLILGGGTVGTEMAQAYRTLGAEVTLVQRSDRILRKEEPFASEQVADALREIGVDVRLDATTERVERSGGTVRLTLKGGERLEGDELLAALGRRPASGPVAALGFATDEPVEVDEHCRTRLPWLYAIGDVNGQTLLTHMGKYQGRLAADHILGKATARDHLATGAGSPRVTFTDPTVAAVGHTLASAEEAGLDVRAVDVGTSGNAGGSFFGRGAPGTARVVIDEETRTVVGATIVGAEVADFLHAATIAVVGRVPLETLWHAVPAFPTRSELWLRWLESYGL